MTTPDTPALYRIALSVWCLILVAAGVLGLTAPQQAAVMRAVRAIVVNEDVPPHREAGPPLAVAAPEPLPARQPAAGERLRGAILGAFEGSTAAHPAMAVAVEGLGHVVDVNGLSPMPPASTQKIYTGAAALMQLGGDTRFRTEIFRTGKVDEQGRLQGHIVLVGSGDPTLTKLQLQAQALQIAASGVRFVQGHVYADEDRYDRARNVNGWKAEFVPFNSGSLSAFALDRNNWRTDAEYLSDPASGNIIWFHKALQDAGIEVAGAASVGPPNGKLTLIAAHESDPMSVIVANMLKSSDNFAAEMLMKEIGRKAGNPTTAGGTEAIAKMTEGFDVGRPHMVDGSGLSIENRQTPWEQVAFLMKIEAAQGAAFRDSLAVSCDIVGTLRNRLCGTPGAGRIYAKSGSLTAVNTLSGYAITASGRRVWFSFLLSGVASPAEAKAAIDRALLAIATFAE
ncbi:MAG TPA: D-alanyl-D-alanine carboxypeptidase/D-alanyl-D-alanine-endopeptidase [Actinomycetota bacterium]|nr:D-alanyl-D-alanine carboxypeptidase/D-alanyl-D-alanine-endopeptidase [Actinomycetota bacterium]